MVAISIKETAAKANRALPIFLLSDSFSLGVKGYTAGTPGDAIYISSSVDGGSVPGYEDTLTSTFSPPDTVLEIVKALSVHGARGRSGQQRRIAESYERLIQTYTSLAGWAARDRTRWGQVFDFSFSVSIPRAVLAQECWCQ